MEILTLQHSIMSINAKGDDYSKNKQKNSEGLGFDVGPATHNLGKRTKIPGHTSSGDFLLLMRDTLPQEWQITDSSAPERDILNGDFTSTTIMIIYMICCYKQFGLSIIFSYMLIHTYS